VSLPRSGWFKWLKNRGSRRGCKELSMISGGGGALQYKNRNPTEPKSEEKQPADCGNNASLCDTSDHKSG